MKLKPPSSSHQVFKNNCDNKSLDLDNGKCVIELKYQSEETSDHVIDNIINNSLTCFDILLA